MSFRRYLEQRAGYVPQRHTAIGVLSIAQRTEDGELAAFALDDGVPITIEKPYGVPEQPTAATAMDETVDTVTVPQQEFVRLTTLSCHVGRAIGVNSPTASDFRSWAKQQSSVDAAELTRLNFIAAQVKQYLGITDGNEFSRWMQRAASVLKHVAEAAKVMA